MMQPFFVEEKISKKRAEIVLSSMHITTGEQKGTVFFYFGINHKYAYVTHNPLEIQQKIALPKKMMLSK